MYDLELLTPSGARISRNYMHNWAFKYTTQHLKPLPKLIFEDVNISRFTEAPTYMFFNYIKWF